MAAATAEKSLQERLKAEPANPDLHKRLGDVEERLGKPVEAVHEYQSAAELNGTETNLFNWGSELLEASRRGACR